VFGREKCLGGKRERGSAYWLNTGPMFIIISSEVIPGLKHNAMKTYGEVAV
jgi:hypothetical protein